VTSFLYPSACLLTNNSRGINEGRQAAREVDLYLEQSTSLPVTGGIVKRTAQEILGKGPARIQVTAAAN
jgi:glutamate synthase (NADPH/NADH)